MSSKRSCEGTLVLKASGLLAGISSKGQTLLVPPAGAQEPGPSQQLLHGMPGLSQLFVEGGRPNLHFPSAQDVQEGMMVDVHRWQIAYTQSSFSVDVVIFFLPLKRLCSWLEIWGYKPTATLHSHTRMPCCPTKTHACNCGERQTALYIRVCAYLGVVNQRGHVASNACSFLLGVARAIAETSVDDRQDEGL
eukprot:1141834-Pelagomonas_calceolata.AAC.2